MENSTKRLLKKWHALVAIFFLAAFATNVQAQNVTISPQNGSMICALTSGSQQTQLGFQLGAFGTWRHNQLSLTMTGSNYSDLTEDGQLAQHSNHFITGDKCSFSPADATRTPSKYIVADWGGDNLRTGYITIALPKGYRFTGYTFHISHDVSKFGQNNNAFSLTTNTSVYMTETNNDFSGNKNRVTLAASSAAVSEFKRTGDDMGNVLYFTTSANSDGFYAVTFRYIELTFTADADASISLLPGSQVSTGASLLEVPFNTGKVDLGEIKQGSYNGATRVSYQFNTVTDMPANMLLYEKESVKDGTGFDGTSGKVAYNQTGHSITTIGHYFKFAPDASKKEQVYFLETPVSAMMAGNIENPVQFRITGATINYTNEASESFYIQYTTHLGFRQVRWISSAPRCSCHLWRLRITVSSHRAHCCGLPRRAYRQGMQHHDCLRRDGRAGRTRSGCRLPARIRHHRRRRVLLVLVLPDGLPMSSPLPSPCHRAECGRRSSCCAVRACGSAAST